MREFPHISLFSIALCFSSWMSKLRHRFWDLWRITGECPTAGRKFQITTCVSLFLRLLFVIWWLCLAPRSLYFISDLLPPSYVGCYVLFNDCFSLFTYCCFKIIYCCEAGTYKTTHHQNCLNLKFELALIQFISHLADFEL